MLCLIFDLVTGWSGHPVCGKRYHFIIRNDSKPLSSCRQTCIHCGTSLPLPDTRWEVYFLDGVPYLLGS